LNPIAVYVHVPFCPTKCGYCDFNSYAMDGPIVERTVRAMVAEIGRSPLAGRPAKTIFFGGGTPTFLDAPSQLRILDAVLTAHPPLAGCEITSEANPGTVDAEKFRALKEGGFNRLSLGAQSFLDSDLIRLGRVHRAREIERAVGLARDAGFDNLNLDLMFALPNQSPKGWSANLETALKLAPEHLSLYCLTIEENTAFYRERLRGELILPQEEDQVEMYEECCRRVAEGGYEQYEISNFSRPGLECRHNLEYWRGAEYTGYGPGAVASYETDGGRVRTTNWKHPVQFCERVEAGQPTPFETERLSPDTLGIERMMLGLRLNKGLEIAGAELPSRGLAKCLDRGWVEVSDERLRLTPEGRHFCSEVALELL
jgi:oxygen-independent coproporphyrinogen III oxidase